MAYLVAPSCRAQLFSDEQAEAMLRDIQQSHIDGNVPPKDNFDEFLRRDLVAYFSKSLGADVVVEYELLRDGPTQTGISFPKFYAWVSATGAGQKATRGAVRLAAIQKERFEVTDFVSEDSIHRDRKQLDRLFPQPVVARISEKLRNDL